MRHAAPAVTYDAIAEATKIALTNGWDGHVIGAPMPAGARLYAMARELAKPVARGHLALTEAHASLINATLAAERSGELGPYKATHVVAGLRHTLALNLHCTETARALVSHRIRRVLDPLIQSHKPPNALLAEAHGVNGSHQFLLSEPEVTDLVRTEVYYSLKPRPARGARGR